MEMRDPNSAATPAEEQNLNPAPAAASADYTQTGAFETEDGVNPEYLAEEEMAEGEYLAEVRQEPLSFETLIERAKEVLAKEADAISTDEIRHLRQQHNALQKDSAPEEGAEAADEAQNPADAEFRALLEQIRAKKAEYTARIEAERAANLQRKEQIIAEIIALAEDTDNVNRTFPRYRELQDEFNAMGEVPATEETSIWKRFQEARERYSDNLKINKELRDYDFKKNLDTKQLLLSEAEGLAKEEDVITAYRRLQELHSKWRQIGPVAKEYREEIWNNFKAASAEVNKRYQAHFEARKAQEAENEAAKTALCEKIESIDLTSLKSFAAWGDATKTIQELQQQWRTLGFASRKANKALFARFRGECDKFFAAKAEYFHSTRDQLAQNLARKTALAERAEALKDSTDWKAASDEFVQLQKEWKTIGTVAKRYSDTIWKRFQQACDAFFEAKKQATGSQRKTENENLRAKQALIAEVEAISPDTPREEAIALLKDVQERWKTIGHVPFREKDKIYEQFRAKLDAVRDALNLRRNQARRERFSENIASIEGDDKKLYREREKLVRALEARRQDLRTYENNLGFLSFSSKNGDSMRREFERKAEALRAEIAELEEKIKLVDSKI